jgi:hypothetical protein
VTFTITRSPAMSDEEWIGGQQGLQEELAQLKALLEKTVPLKV